MSEDCQIEDESEKLADSPSDAIIEFLNEHNAANREDLIELLMEKCDLFLGILWRRFGTPTAPENHPERRESGTLEEWLIQWVQERKKEGWVPGRPVGRPDEGVLATRSVPERYINYLNASYGFVECFGSEIKVKVAIDLERVYVPLRGRLAWTEERRD